jgi:hypothetical protein
VLCGVEGAFEVCVDYAYVFLTHFGVLHHQYDGEEGVVDAALVMEAILLVA